MDVQRVFQVNARSTSSLLNYPGLGLYIPAYQRPYSWDKDNVTRFVRDILQGIVRCEHSKDSLTFLGTLIQVADPRPASVHPKVAGDLPKGLTLLIDGQQRLTTILMLNLCLHEELERAIQKLPSSVPELDRDWLLKRALRLQGLLLDSLYLKMPGADPSYEFYPRMIRAHVDTWSSSRRSAKYGSPIAELLHSYAIYANSEADRASSFSFKRPTDMLKRHKEFYTALRILRQFTKGTRTGNDERRFDFSEFLSVVESGKATSTLLPEDVPGYTDATGPAIRLLLVGTYLADRVCITSVTVEEEDYAFDMFEALNTTGEPLTAYETLRPRIVEAEGLEEYEASPVKPHVDYIDGFFESLSQAKRRRETAKLVSHFALAEKGDKRGRKLSEQRRFLRDSFPRSSVDEQRAFVEHLRRVVEFSATLWAPEDDSKAWTHDIFKGDEQAALALRALSESGHEITVALLAQWFQAWVNEPNEDTARSFQTAVKAVAAFFAVWRLTRTGTANVDARIRKLMKEGEPAVGLEPVARILRAPSPLEEDALLAALRKILGGVDIVDEMTFVAKLKQIPVYKQSKVHTRLILLMASHDAIPDPDVPGLLMEASNGVCPMLTRGRWKEAAQTIEHVAPQERRKGTAWDASVYETAGAMHRIGNLTMLPRVINAAVSNREWKQKKELFRLLSAKTPAEMAARRRDATAAGIEVGEFQRKSDEYQAQVEALASVEHWDLKKVDERSERLGHLAWRTISKWLDWEG